MNAEINKSPTPTEKDAFLLGVAEQLETQAADAEDPRPLLAVLEVARRRRERENFE